MIGEPLQFHPLLKRICWGGRRLGEVLHKPLGPEADYAESWELADHRDGQSVVDSGTFGGRTLADLVKAEGAALFGSRPLPCPEQFPLLVKFLDAHERLSVQVHPNDAQAKSYLAGENGKTEAWVILDAAPGSQVYAGLKPHVDRRAFEAAIHDGAVEGCLYSYAVRAGDCVFVPAGTVHAIGAGILLAEVQQASNLTFRVHDWGRVGPDGGARALHLQEALECIDFERGPVPPVAPSLADCEDHRNGQHIEVLVESPCFTLRRHMGSVPLSFPEADHFRVLIGLAGEGRLRCAQSGAGDEGPRFLRAGSTWLLPADCPQIDVHPEQSVTLLEAFV